MHDSEEEHLQVVQQVLPYLKVIHGRGLLFQNGGERY